MSTTFIPRRPPTFEPGQTYAWFESRADQRGVAAIPVTVIAYDPCPAFVIVRTGAGERRRCLREQLYCLSSPAGIPFSHR